MRRAQLTIAAVVLAGIAAAVLVAANDGGYDGRVAAFDGRSPRAPVGERVRVLVELQRPSLGERVERDGELEAAVQHAHVRDLERESRALKSALNAKGVELRDLVVYSRVWSGFAATIATDELPEVQTQGLRVEPVRRFYPAAAGVARVPGMLGTLARQPRPESGGEPALALLDSAVDDDHERLRGRVEPGYDAVSRDGDPFLDEEQKRGDEHGTQVAGVLADALGDDERFVAVRVAGAQRDAETGGVDEFATTDQLVSGLEFAVDPDRDGDTSDGLPVALSGVSSPYSGFPGTPESDAAAAAAALGTLLVAPAGNEGEPGGRFGTIGSPAASEDVLAVAALEGGDTPAPPRAELGLASDEGRAKLEATLLAGGGRALHAPVTDLAGPSQADPRAEGRSAGGAFGDYFTADGRPRARGRAVVVPLRSSGGRKPALAARASAAASAGAAALVVCDPEADDPPAPLPRAAGGRLPVLGLAGDDAERALELAEAGGDAFVSEPEQRDSSLDEVAAASSSRGPTYGFAMKPDVAAPGSAVSTAAGGGEAFVSGTSVAAARAASAAVELHRARPDAPPADLAAALVGAARPLGGSAATGAGEVDAEAARKTTVIARPASVTFPAQPAEAGWSLAREVELVNTGDEPLEIELSAQADAPSLEAKAPESVRLEPGAGALVLVTLRAKEAATGFLTGRVEGSWDGGRVVVPFGVSAGDPPPPRLGELELVRQGERVRGVQFSAGALSEPQGALAVEPLGELRLVLVPADGGDGRELTPPGGAGDLLPGEYAYTLTDEILEELPAGSYRFEARARGPAGGGPVERRSGTFEVP